MAPLSEQESGGPAANLVVVDIDRMLAERVDRDMDEVLGTLVLVRDDEELARRVSDQLVDLLVESLFLDLRRRLTAGDMDRGDFSHEVARLAAQCRDAGLLPLRPQDS